MRNLLIIVNLLILDAFIDSILICWNPRMAFLCFSIGLLGLNCRIIWCEPSMVPIIQRSFLQLVTQIFDNNLLVILFTRNSHDTLTWLDLIMWHSLILFKIWSPGLFVWNDFLIFSFDINDLFLAWLTHSCYACLIKNRWNFIV